MVAKACLSSSKQDWRTPPEIVELVKKIGPICLDPCADPYASEWIAGDNIFPPADGLQYRWADAMHGSSVVYVNPPYNQIRKWVKKATEESAMGAQIIMLIPARTDTRAWSAARAHARAICYWTGRIKFVGAQACAPFPSALIYWGDRPYRFADVFQDYGHIEVLR